MKFECSKEKFEIAVGLAQKIAGRQMNLPVLSCIKIEAQKNSIILSATNLDLAIEYKLPAKVIKEGVVAVPALVLSNLLSNLSGEKNVTAELFQGNLRVICSKSSTIVKAVQHDDFPNIPRPSGGNVFKIPNKDLVVGLSSVVHFCAVSAVKPELGSVLMYSDDGELYFVATDSFRLGEKKIKVKDPVDVKALVPSKNIPEIIRTLSLVTETASVSIYEHQLTITCGDIYIASRLIEGNFPDYKQIIPKGRLTEVIMLKEDITQVLKALSIFSDKFNQLHISALPREKRFEVSTKNSDIGESYHAPQAALSGEAVEVNFNIRYLLDCLPIILSDSVSFEFNGSGKPLLLRGVGESTFLYLVMPMNK